MVDKKTMRYIVPDKCGVHHIIVCLDNSETLLSYHLFNDTFSRSQNAALIASLVRPQHWLVTDFVILMRFDCT